MPHVEVPQAEFKVVMLGDTFTGKTSLVLRFAEGYYRESARSATVGAFFITKRLSVQGMTCKIQIWDTAGQEQFKKLAPMYYKNAAAAIICYDVTSPQSFETLKYWVHELQNNLPSGGIMLALCATKCDLTSGFLDTSQAEALAEEVGAMFMATSSKDNENVTETFEKVAERVLQARDQEGGPQIKVTLATTSVETNERHTTSPTSAAPIHSQPRIGSPVVSSHTERSDGKGFHLADEKKQEDDEDNVVDPTESNDSTVESKARCDAMLMCGDGEMMGGENGQGCSIQ